MFMPSPSPLKAEERTQAKLELIPYQEILVGKRVTLQLLEYYFQILHAAFKLSTHECRLGICPDYYARFTEPIRAAAAMPDERIT